MKKIVCALTLFVAVAGWGRAATVAKPPAVPASTSAAKGAPARSLPDAQIEHAIQMKFAKSKINAEHFTVSVHGGVATLEGKTGVMQHKGVATRLAKAGGATVVKNNIQVSDAAKAKAAAHLARNASAATTPAAAGNTGGSAPPQLVRATVLPAK